MHAAVWGSSSVGLAPRMTGDVDKGRRGMQQAAGSGRWLV